MKRSFAIVGSGPGGMYAAQGLLDKSPDCRIDVIERLPSPYGLIRGGVAPDHQKTKRVSLGYDRTLANPRVRYLGNVEVGRDIMLGDLLACYDAVILACGAPHDNHLGIPGETLSNVYGSNAFVGWYNGHPDFTDLDPDLNVDAAAVVGIGNVALDVARVLVKTPEEMSTSDLVPHAAEAIYRSPVRDVYMFGRRGPVEAAFTNVELREMGQLTNAAPIVDPEHLPEAAVAAYMSDRDLRLRQKNLDTLKSFLDVPAEGKQRRVHFEFFASPVEILGSGRVEGLRLERTTVDSSGRVSGTGEMFDVPCSLVITCIGSRANPFGDLPFDERRGIVRNEDGRVGERIYSVGWLKRGASGTIGTNKNDSLDVVARTLSDNLGPQRPGGAAIDAMLVERNVRVVSFSDWQVIDRIEVRSAPDGAPRQKFVTPDAMLDALHETRSAS